MGSKKSIHCERWKCAFLTFFYMQIWIENTSTCKMFRIILIFGAIFLFTCPIHHSWCFCFHIERQCQFASQMSVPIFNDRWTQRKVNNHQLTFFSIPLSLTHSLFLFRTIGSIHAFYFWQQMLNFEAFCTFSELLNNWYYLLWLIDQIHSWWENRQNIYCNDLFSSVRFALAQGLSGLSLNYTYV